MPQSWTRRFKHNREKIKTGDVYALAEVVRNLSIRESEKGLSAGERQMYSRAKRNLASEFMYALDKDENGAESYLDELLEERFGAGGYGLGVPRRQGRDTRRRLRREARSRRSEGHAAVWAVREGKGVRVQLFLLGPKPWKPPGCGSRPDVISSISASLRGDLQAGQD